MNYTEIFKKGGKSPIHIKKKNRGKFTASAKAAGESVLEHAHKVMNNPNATPLLRKRANFAIQAKKWHHKKHYEGGALSYIGFFQTGSEITTIPSNSTFSKIKVPGSNTFKKSDIFSSDSTLYAGDYSERYIPYLTTASEIASKNYSITAPKENAYIAASLEYLDLTPEVIGLIQLCHSKGIDFNITAGYSNSGHASNSRHYEGGAIDITPIKGQTWDELINKFVSDPDIVEYMNKNLGGLLDERTNKTGSKNWTGAHLHLSFKTPSKLYGEYYAVANWNEIKRKHRIA